LFSLFQCRHIQFSKNKLVFTQKKKKTIGGA